jgi:signal transduction histidine kinase
VYGTNADISERKRAEEELRASNSELRALSARVESAREEERTRIAREIHDDLGQRLTALRIDLAWVEEHAPAEAARVRRKVAEMTAAVDSSIGAVQRLATELRPAALDRLGLKGGIRWLAGDFEGRTGIRCRYRITTRRALPPDGTATALFRILQEALTNVARHAAAKHVDILLRDRGTTLELTVRDDGRGVTDEEAAGPKALGILGMRERAQSRGGSLSIRGLPGRGTEVVVSLPRHDAAQRGRRAG